LQPIGIALTIPPLVMTTNSTSCKVQFIECADQTDARLGMAANDGQLIICQATGLEQNLIGNCQFPQVMDHRRGVHILDLALIESNMRGKRCSERCHTVAVSGTLAFLRFDESNEHFDAAVAFHAEPIRSLWTLP